MLDDEHGQATCFEESTATHAEDDSTAEKKSDSITTRPDKPMLDHELWVFF